MSTLPSEVIECHASDSDCSGALLNKFQRTKLNQSKSAPSQVLKLKCGARVVFTRNIDVAGGVVNGTIGTVENIQPNLITVRRLKDNKLMCKTRIKHYGDCLWNAISNCLCGDERYMYSLRVLTAYDFKERMVAQLCVQYLCDMAGADRRWSDLLRIAITPTAWGTDFHVCVISVVLNNYSHFHVYVICM